MKRIAWRLAATAAILGVAGFIVAASGLVPIKASSGHWPITEWFLRFGMHRSFATHSLGVTVPRLDDPNLIVKGATHFEFGCRSCHGAPGARQPRIGQRMTPPAPNLAPLVGNWKPAQLFSLVKHGVKFTGMPAWPAQQRDDEVWAVVAFLLALPRLDAASYQELARGDPPTTPPIRALGPTDALPPTLGAVEQSCARCHGSDGMGRGTTVFPRLAGQRREYLAYALATYTAGTRPSGIMEPIAAGLSEPMLNALADHYSRLSPAPSARPPVRPVELLDRGRRIANEGIRAQRLPACVDCHEPSGRRAKPSYPSLAGQPAEYLMLQLDLFQKGHRGRSPNAHLMEHVAPRLTPAQIEAVAFYFESLPARRPSESR